MHLNKEMMGQVLKLAIAFALVGVVVSEISIESMTVLWQRISVSWFLVGIFAFYAGLWSMTRRYWLLIGSRITFSELLHIVLYQNIMGNLITTSAGAAWYVGTLRTKHDIPVANGLLSLLVARFGDLLVLLVSVSFATLFVWQQIPTLHLLITVVICLLAAVASGCLLVFVFRRRLAGFTEGIVAKCDFYQSTFVPRFIATLTVLSSQEVKKYRLRIAPFTGYSALILGAMLIFAYSNLRVFGVPIDIWSVVFVVSLTQVMTLLPIQVFGGLGLQDISYLYLYGLFGINQSELAAVVVGLRICFVFTNLVFLVLVAPSSGLVMQNLFRKEIT